MACSCDMHGKAGMHCRRCCHTLSGISAFDQHWKRGHQLPADAGLVQVRPGVWGLPGSEGNRERLARLRGAA